MRYHSSRVKQSVIPPDDLRIKQVCASTGSTSGSVPYVAHKSRMQCRSTRAGTPRPPPSPPLHSDPGPFPFCAQAMETHSVRGSKIPLEPRHVQEYAGRDPAAPTAPVAKWFQENVNVYEGQEPQSR